MNAVLTVKNLTVYRNTHAAVQQVSFSLEPGSNTAIVGPNGAGKSTLIQALLGIFPRQEGEVLVLGQPLSRSGRLPASTRQQIAYLPQQFLFDQLIPITVEEVVGLGWDELGFQLPWRRSRQRRLAVRQALSKVDLMHRRQHLIGGLSGGELKRVLLAYCLVRPRRLLVLDEAPTGLDVQVESEFYHLLNQLKQEQGWSILQICHDLERVRRHCDYVLCLNQTLRSQGTPNIVLSPNNLATVYGVYSKEFAKYHSTFS